MILTNTRLRDELTGLVESSSGLEDVLVFGSVVRGKRKPSDVDVLVLFAESVDKPVELKVRKIIEGHFPDVSTVSKTLKTAVEASFDARESVLFEARSLITGENLAERYGFVSWGMFKYSFGDWSKLQKTKFYHALNGRGGSEGVLSSVDGVKLSDGVVLVPLGAVEEFREFIEKWGLEFIYVPVMLPARMARKGILGVL
ncbi:nucleotidyltransferase domain-containing protein [Nanoarchaeota archaeon]